jgi:hypothetical protein
MLFGDLAIGHIEGEAGFGYQATGRDLQGLKQLGFPDTGRKDEGAGSGFLDIGITAETCSLVTIQLFEKSSCNPS